MRMCKQNSAAGNVKQHIMFHGYKNETKLPHFPLWLSLHTTFEFSSLKPSSLINTLKTPEKNHSNSNRDSYHYYIWNRAQMTFT